MISAVPEIDEVARFIFLNIPPYVGHLWYLLAMITGYLVLWVYVRFFGEDRVNYRPLYLISACLLVNQIIAGAIMDAVETANAFYWCRTAFLAGIPMFTLGIFIRENQERLASIFPLTTGKHLFVFLGCILLSIIQWLGGIGSGIMEFGTILGTVVLMLLLLDHPVIVKPDSVAGKCISRFGFVSKWVYILHLMVMFAYEEFLQQSMVSVLGSNEPWLRPLLVLVITLLAVITWDQISLAYKRRICHR